MLLLLTSIFILSFSHGISLKYVQIFPIKQHHQTSFHLSPSFHQQGLPVPCCLSFSLYHPPKSDLIPPPPDTILINSSSGSHWPHNYQIDFFFFLSFLRLDLFLQHLTVFGTTSFFWFIHHNLLSICHYWVWTGLSFKYSVIKIVLSKFSPGSRSRDRSSV